MAQLDYNKTVDDNDVESSFEAIPAGEYIAVIESSDYVENKNKTGKMLKLTYQVIDGPLKGRKIFENLNLENKNQQAEQISQKALNSIKLAVGVKDLKDSVQLHDIPLKIDVTVKESEDFGKQNRIKKHLPLSGTPAISSAPASAEPKKKSWEK